MPPNAWSSQCSVDPQLDLRSRFATRSDRKGRTVEVGSTWKKRRRKQLWKGGNGKMGSNGQLRRLFLKFLGRSPDDDASNCVVP